MEKLKMHSPNLTQDNIARIRDLFPVLWFNNFGHQLRW